MVLIIQQATKPVGGIPTILGEGHGRADLESLLVVGDGLLQVVSPVAADALLVGISQVVLRPGPVLGEGLTRADLESLLVVEDGLLQVVSPFASDALLVGVSQVVLRPGPVLGESL